MLKYISSRINSVAAAAFLVAMSSFVSRLLGVVRDRILAGQFGAGQELDIYYAAFRIPDFIFNLIVLGALSAGFIPVISRMIKKGEDSGNIWRVSSNVINILSLLLILLSVLGMIFAEPLIKLITPGFSPEAIIKTASLTRIMFISPFLLGISGVIGGILQAYKRFFLYSMSPIFYNLGIIFGALWLAPRYGLVGLAWGVAIGALFHLLVQLPALLSLGFKYHPIISTKDKGTREVARMTGPRVLSLAVSQINIFIITFLASKLESGSLSVFNLANNIQSFPVGIFGISFAIAAFPSFSEVYDEDEELGKRFFSVARQILFFVIPVTVMFITLRAQITRVIFGTGSFDWNDTILTMNTIGFFSLSLFAQSLIPLLSRVFYAKHDSRTPFYIGLVCVVLNLPLSYYLSSCLGVSGLALAFSLISIINFLLLWLVLYSRSNAFSPDKVILPAFKFSIAAIATGLAIQASKLAIWPLIDMTKFSGVFIQMFVSASVGGAVFLGFCWLLKAEEVFVAVNIIKRRLPFRKMPEENQDEVRGL